MATYNLNFRGYWIDSHKNGLPEGSGIYLVYKCVYKENIRKVSLRELVYIGQANNLKTRIDTHDKREKFLQDCVAGETICYSIAEIPQKDLDIVESALIFMQNPKFNERKCDVFNYDTTELHLEGRCGLMKYVDFKISNE